MLEVKKKKKVKQQQYPPLKMSDGKVRELKRVKLIPAS